MKTDRTIAIMRTLEVLLPAIEVSEFRGQVQPRDRDLALTLLQELKADIAELENRLDPEFGCEL
jgi:hypothetical protein